MRAGSLLKFFSAFKKYRISMGCRKGNINRQYDDFIGVLMGHLEVEMLM